MLGLPMKKCIKSIKQMAHLRWFAGLCLCLLTTTSVSAAVTLVKNGKSSFAIFHDPSAPQTNLLAAQELQRVIRLSTGVTIPIQKVPADPMICVGDNPSLRKVGLSVDNLPDDGYRIVTRDGNIYIAGKDTADGQSVWRGCTSRGTLFGVYTFLEDVVGVRWLMPGEDGEDIPRHEELIVPERSREEFPDFPYRRLQDIQCDRPEVQTWMMRQKMTERAAKMEFYHAWEYHLSPEILKAHPEYLAVEGDKSKFCTTNPELIRLFAQSVIKWLREHPTWQSASISASDGGGFCQCKKCQALVRKDPHGETSNTLMLLHFYNSVAKIVGKEMPDRILGALVYYDYMYSPAKPVAIEPNLYLQLAPLEYYGYGLYKPRLREEFRGVISGWTALTPNFCYTNYSTWMRAMNGSPLPVGLDILKFEIPILKELNVKGVAQVGSGSWGSGGVCNYILIKQLWNAKTDVDALYREWLARAYGPGWKSMDRLYALLDQRMKARKEKEGIKYQSDMYEVNADLVKELYVPIFPTMEKLYRDALAKTETQAQRARLEMFGDNMIAFHFYLRQAGLLNEPKKSVFYRSDREFEQFYKKHASSLTLSGSDINRIVPIYIKEWNGDKTIYLKDVNKKGQE